MNSRAKGWTWIVLGGGVAIGAVLWWASSIRTETKTAGAFGSAPSQAGDVVRRDDAPIVAAPAEPLRTDPSARETQRPKAVSRPPENLGTPWIPGTTSDQPFFPIETTAAPIEPSKAGANGSLAASIGPIVGGVRVIAAQHAGASPEQRQQRVEAIEQVLALYTEGEPKEPSEFELYEALKDELVWLKENPR